MTTFLYNGWMLSCIAIGVVFIALFILYIIYSLIGKMVIAGENAEKGLKKAARKAKKLTKSAAGSDEDQIAAAIAIALEQELKSDIHDNESGIITIRHASERGVRNWWNIR